MGGCCSRNGCRTELKCREDEEDDEEQFYEAEDDGVSAGDDGAQIMLRGSCRFASMFSQQGWKGANQDAMTVWLNFMGDEDKIFCGVFDGHGPSGHKVAGYVRDALPKKLSNLLTALQDSKTNEDSTEANGKDETNVQLIRSNSSNVESRNSKWYSLWNTNVIKAFEDIDEELSSRTNIDSICSGGTAIALVREREHLIVANLGDSRAVLCTHDSKNRPVAVQLTVDQKPDLPSEAERIRSCQGRVFALDEEPDIYRVWMPDEDCPGLAMARAFGDFCLKDYGLIATPQITYTKLSQNDEFIVLATDGVWDVLSNTEVVKIVSSAKKQSEAAKQVVYRAVRAWRYKHPTSLVDDCTVICLFLKPETTFPNRRQSGASSEFSFSESFTTAKSKGDSSESEIEVTAKSKELLNGSDGLCRVNSALKHPRLSSALSWRKKSFRGA